MSTRASQGAIISRKAADGVVVAAPCAVVAVTVYCADATVTSAKIYDHASAASGTYFEVSCPATAGQTNHYFFGDEGINMSNGCYVDGTFGHANSSVTVFYKT